MSALPSSGAAPASSRLSAFLESTRLHITVAILVISAAHAVGRIGAYCAPTRADSYLYAAIGYRMARGEALYGPTLSDVKPPAVYALYALAYTVLPPGRASMIPVDVLVSAFGYWCVHGLARLLHGPGVALILTSAFALVVNSLMVLDFATEAFGLAECFMIPPAALAAACYLAAPATQLNRRLVVLGGALGLGLAVKQSAVALTAAVCVHFMITVFVERAPWRRTFKALGLMFVGAGLAALPFIALTLAQGTWSSALISIGPRAVGLLSGESAWPIDLQDVAPLSVPLAWSAIGLLAFGHRAPRPSRPDDQCSPSAVPHGVPPRCLPCDRSRSTGRTGRLSFLLIWLVAEFALWTLLPLRAAHYYIPACMPLLMVSGVLWTQLASLHRFARSPAIAVAGIASLAFLRPLWNRITPITIARFQTYDADADRARFDALLRLPTLLLGPANSDDNFSMSRTRPR